MVKCPICGKEFHACSSCYLTYHWEYTYCSEECWKKSIEYGTVIHDMILILNAIPRDLLDTFKRVMDNSDGDYYATFVELIEDAKKGLDTSGGS